MPSLEDVLRVAPAGWAERLAAEPPENRWALGVAIAREWISGRLEPRFVNATSGEPLVTLRRHLAQALEAAGVADELELEVHRGNLDESTARRWCWVGPWRLMEQDEDLLLMADPLVAALLEEAAHQCPKRDYALSIVEHHLRDSAHAALRAGADALRVRLRELAALRPAVVATRHPPLEAYLTRLEGYARPQRVDQREAAARISDLWRCHAPERVELEPERRGEWRARYGSAPASWIVVERKTGAMRLEEA